MTPAETEAVRAELAVLTVRAEAAERRAKLAETQRDHLRALLTRLKTSLAEAFNDPGAAEGAPCHSLTQGLSGTATPSMRQPQ